MIGVSLYYQNVRGLRTKTSSFRLALLESDYDIVTLSETWLNSTVYNSELFSQEYTIFRRDRNERLTGKGRGGGVLIAVKNKFKAIRLFNIETDEDNIWIKVTF